MTKRVQRKRTKGWKMPPNTKYVGRPTKWGNPYRVGEWYLHPDDIFANPFNPERRYCKTVEESVELYRMHIKRELNYGRLDLEELRGLDLACFCSLSSPCHVDVLLELLK